MAISVLHNVVTVGTRHMYTQYTCTHKFTHTQLHICTYTYVHAHARALDNYNEGQTYPLTNPSLKVVNALEVKDQES